MRSRPPHSAGDDLEYFLLRPEVERAYGYSHAVRVGRDIKISGAVSMDDEGRPTTVGDIEQQMKNAYRDRARGPHAEPLIPLIAQGAQCAVDVPPRPSLAQ